MAIEYWYKGDKRIRIDNSDKVATASFTKKGYGLKKTVAPLKPKIEEVKTIMINPNTGPVHVPDEEVEKRLSQGWTLQVEPKKVEEPKSTKKKDK